jgi:putative flippase GtrA
VTTGATTTVSPPRTRRAFMRFARFLVASGFASLTSLVTFAAAYRFAEAGPSASTFAAFATGSAVSFAISRFWAWERRGTGVGREALAFFGLAFVVAVVAAGATTVTEHLAMRAGVGRDPRMLLVAGAYVGTYGALYMVKFAILDRWVFRSPAPPSVIAPDAGRQDGPHPS